MSNSRKTWHERYFGPQPPLTESQQAMRGPLIGFVLILVTCNIGLFFFYGHGSNPSFWVNLCVSCLLLVQNLSAMWIREGRAGIFMRTLALVVTIVGLIAIVTFVVHDFRHLELARTEPVSPTTEIIQQSEAAYAALSSYESSGEATCEKAGKIEKIQFTIRLQRPNFYRVTWHCGECSGVAWSDGTGDFSEVDGKVTKEKDRSAALWEATDYSDLYAHIIADVFFHDIGSDLKTPSLLDERKPDEAIGDTDCYVITNDTRPEYSYGGTTTYWIGKKDGLIHQHQSVMSKAFKISHMTEADWTKYLKSENKPVTAEALATLKASETRSNAQTESELPIISTQPQTQIVLNKSFSATDFTH